jgi:hypothetical protein
MAYFHLLSTHNSLRRTEMKKKTTFGIGIAITATALLLSSSGVSFAQPPWLNAAPEEMPKAFMAHEDDNGDGKVTPEEYNGPEDHWNFFDKNKDGVIDISEAARPDNMPPGI